MSHAAGITAALECFGLKSATLTKIMPSAPPALVRDNEGMQPVSSEAAKNMAERENEKKTDLRGAAGGYVLEGQKIAVAIPGHNSPTSLQYWKDYLNHTALNAGQATRDVRHLFNHPDADAVAPEGSARHMLESLKHRVPSLANNVKYTLLPPQWHHAPDDLMNMGHATPKQWFMHGYAPWDHPLPEKLGFWKLADVDTPLQPHQQRVVDRLLKADQPGLVAMHGLGSGKTLTSIAVADALGLPADVVLPAALRANYVKELHKHAPHDAPETHIQSLENAARTQTKLTNPLLIVDEAHRSRNPTQAQRALRNTEAKKRLLLTGSLFYNQPSDAAGPVNIAAGHSVLPSDPDDFRRLFVSEVQHNPGFVGKLLGKEPTTSFEVNPANREYLQGVLKKYVDYHPSSKTDFPFRSDETIRVPMGVRQKEIYDTIMGRAPAWVHERVVSGLPPKKSEIAQLNRFLQGTRQVSNSTAPYHLDRPPDQPKIRRAVEELQKLLDENPRAKALVYSNYLDAGIGPYKQLLDERKIPYGEFTGAMTRKKRDQMVQDYNANKLRALLLSRAGGEGLDLKGTRLIQLLEPHWNEEGPKQVIGRGIRFRSHADLPEDQRNVRVQHFITENPRRGPLQHLRLKDPERSVDQYLQGLARQKEELNQKFRDLLEEPSMDNTKKAFDDGCAAAADLFGVKIADALTRAVQRGAVSPSIENAMRLRAQFPSTSRTAPATVQKTLAGMQQPGGSAQEAQLRNLRENLRKSRRTTDDAMSEIHVRGMKPRMRELTNPSLTALFKRTPISQTGGALYEPATGAPVLRRTPEVERRLGYAAVAGGDTKALQQRLQKQQISADGVIAVNPRLPTHVLRPALEHEVGERWHAEQALRGKPITPFAGHYGPEATVRELTYAAASPKSWATSVADRMSPNTTFSDQQFMPRYTQVGGTRDAPVPMDSRQSRAIQRMYDREFARTPQQLEARKLPEDRITDLRNARIYALQGLPLSPGVEAALAHPSVQARFNRHVPREHVNTVARQSRGGQE